MPLRIEDYALIGDCQTAALIGRDGSIDWLCWPGFDSDACFAALLGAPKHGRWLIAPIDETARVTRRYRPNTLILETRFESAEGIATLVDFMPRGRTGSGIVRLIIGERGRIRMRTEMVIRFGYGATVPWMTKLDDGTRRAVAGPDMALLRTTAPLRGEDFKTVGEFTVGLGETVPFTLTYRRICLFPRQKILSISSAPLKNIGLTGPPKAEFPVRGRTPSIARSSH
jgi:Domain of unknown function (DUF5911)